jgi:hypothetical protein
MTIPSTGTGTTSSTLLTPHSGAADPRALARMSRDDLDALFRASVAGSIPVGQARGTAMVFPGTAVDRALQGLVRAFCWKGKVFARATHDLKNRIGPTGALLIRAKVYEGDSWFAPGTAIILDYSKTSVVAGKIRDEIRQVGPGLYLGQVYWGKRRIALFMLEFPGGGTPP